MAASQPVGWRAVADAGLSLNEYCACKLAAKGVEPAGPGGAVVARAAAAFGGDLMGVVAYGSWARGEHTPDSDVDVLVVVEPRVPLTPGLYREWDDEPSFWCGHPVEPHFAQPIGPGGPPTGTWVEAAIDGIVLFERGFALSRRLAAIRRRIVAGDIVRRSANGQPYLLVTP